MNISEIGTSDGNNITLTSTFYQDGSAFKSSQWDDDGSSIYYSGGNVGINVVSPLEALDVNGVVHLRSGTTGYSTGGGSIDTTSQTNTYISFGESGTVNDWCYLRQIGGSNNYQLAFDFHDDGTDAGFFIRDVKSTNTPDSITTRFCVTGGNVGIGTTNPHAMLHVAGQGTNKGALSNSNRRYFSGGGQGFTTTSGPGEHGGMMSIYAWSRIVTSDYFIAHGSSSFSDRRIKANIVDVEDDICLQKLRLIKPKQYTYQDTKSKGTAPVWGFIAQEVAEIMDYAVDKMEKAIPNVYKLASVSEDGLVLTFDEPVSLEPMDTIRLQLKTFVSEEHDVIVSEVLSPTTISLTEPLTEEHHIGIVDGESIVRKVFVYGQWVDDFHVLKKDAIFTVAVAALQEVDRRQVEDNEHILELKETVSIQQQKLEEQSQLITSLQASILELTKRLDALS